MARPPLLVVAQRLPFPAHSGDRLRSFNLITGLSERFEIHLGAFGDPTDGPSRRKLEKSCAQVFVAPDTRLPAARIGRALVTGRSLSEGLVWSRAMARWVDSTVRRTRPCAALVSTGALAPYVLNLDGPRRIVDLVDVDSEKWRLYGELRPAPMSWVYRREYRKVRELETRTVQEADATVVVSPEEADLLLGHPGVPASRVHVATNGVDVASFDPSIVLPNPYPPAMVPLVFTGVMKYWPNIDGVTWFADECLPAIRRRVPAAHLWIVGHGPTRSVRALGRRPGIEVTGQVDDVRPFLQHAHVAVAPLRVARGAQNKVLEALAMGQVIVTTPPAFSGLPVRLPWRPVDGARATIDRVVQLLERPDREVLGARNRDLVIRDASWAPSVEVLADLLEGRR